MPSRLPELSYRLAHHFPDALPFIVPFYNKLQRAGFEIDERHLKPVIRRNGQRIVAEYAGSTVTFRPYGQRQAISHVNLARLRRQIEGVKRVRDYAVVDAQLDQLVANLRDATE